MTIRSSIKLISTQRYIYIYIYIYKIFSLLWLYYSRKLVLLCRKLTYLEQLLQMRVDLGYCQGLQGPTFFPSLDELPLVCLRVTNFCVHKEPLHESKHSVWERVYLSGVWKRYPVLKTWFYHLTVWKSVQFSSSTVSDSLRSHGLQHARLPCTSPSPRACSN